MLTFFDLLEDTNVETRMGGKAAIENGYPFDAISTIAEVESWRKEIYRPIYHIHKWWAKRLGSVFRSIILASVLPENAPVMDLFYRKNDFGGLIVFDPFMGSGTTIGEAAKLGCTAIGRDINPVAYNVVRATFSAISIKDANRLFREIELSVGKRIKGLYELEDGCQTLYYFWVKLVDCPVCGNTTELFNKYVFSRHAYPSRNPVAQCFCTACGDVFSCRYDSTEETCPTCSYRFNPQIGPAKRAKVSCLKCGCEFRIIQAVRASGVPPAHRMYAKLVLRNDGVKEYRRITEEDLTTYSKAEDLLESEPPLIAGISIEPGHNTNQVINYCYTRWEQFFNARQLIALSWLGREIQNIENPDLRFAFAILFSGILEFNNMFCSFKGEGTGAVRHMFSHHILKPERQPLEANVWGTPKSSGSFSTLFKSRLLRALEYRAAPFEVTVGKAGKKVKGGKRYGCSMPISDNLHLAEAASDMRPRSVYLSCGDSSNTDLLDQSVDLIVTDPPFFDNVHYSELADFFYAWQMPLLGELPDGRKTTRDPREVQDRDEAEFSEKLAGVFTECHRVLKDEGILAFTYHHSREEGWSSVARALAESGFRPVIAHPVKAEMALATPKHSAKEPIDLDIILICRKEENDGRPFLDPEEALNTSVRLAQRQISAFWEQGRWLSRNDIGIILRSQLLVALSTKRTKEEFASTSEQYGSRVNKEIERLFASQQTNLL